MNSRKQIFWIQPEMCKYELTVPVTASTRHPQAQTIENKSQFSLTVWFVVCHSRVDPMPKNTGQDKLNLVEKGGERKTEKGGERERRNRVRWKGGMGGSGRIGRNKYDQQILMKFSKLIKKFKCVIQNMPTSVWTLDCVSSLHFCLCYI